MGIVPGGGSVLLHLTGDKLLQEVKDILSTNDERMGAQVVFGSLVAPMRQIATNAGDDPSEVVFRTSDQNFGFGYNAATQSYENLMDAGVVDPAKVVINAVVNAASIASMV